MVVLHDDVCLAAYCATHTCVCVSDQSTLLPAHNISPQLDTSMLHDVIIQLATLTIRRSTEIGADLQSVHPFLTLEYL